MIPIVRGWIEDQTFDLKLESYPGERRPRFVNAILSTMTLASIFDKRHAIHYVRRSPCHHIQSQELQLLDPRSGIPASLSSMSFLLECEPVSFQNGVTFARSVGLLCSGTG